MPDTLTAMGKGGGLTNPLGSDAISDISAADATLVATDMGKLRRYYNTALGRKITLPDATTLTANNKVKSVGIALNDGSPPVAIFNAGTAGTDPVLEAVIAGGCVGALTAFSTASAKGTWGKQGGVTLPGFPWPAGGAPITKSVGAVTGATAAANQYQQQVMLTSTLGAFIWLDSSALPQLMAFSLNANGTPNAISNATALRAGKTCSDCQVIAMSTTKVVCAWYNATDTIWEYSAVVLTPGNPPTIGSPGAIASDTTVTANDRIAIATNAGAMLVKDNTDSFFQSGRMITTAGMNAYHFTLAGTTITLNTSNAFNTNAQNLNMSLSLSPSANTLMVLTMGAAYQQFQLLTYAAGTISVTWTSLSVEESPASANVVNRVIDVDGANGYFGLLGTNRIFVFKVDLATGVISQRKEVSYIAPNQVNNGFNPMFATGAGGTDIAAVDLGSGELAFVMNSVAGGNFFLYLDLRTAVAPGPTASTAGIMVDRATAVHVYPFAWARGPAANTKFAFDPTTRTLVVNGTPRVQSGNVSFSMQTFFIPRK